MGDTSLIVIEKPQNVVRNRNIIGNNANAMTWDPVDAARNMAELKEMMFVK